MIGESDAKKSRGGGPKTLKGKKVVSQNATKFGVYSSTFFVNRDAEFQNELNTLVLEMGAGSSVEISLLESYLGYYHKKKKIEVIFEDELKRELARDITPAEFERELGYAIKSGTLKHINAHLRKSEDSEIMFNGLPTKNDFKDLKTPQERILQASKFPIFLNLLLTHNNEYFSESSTMEDVLNSLDNNIELDNGDIDSMLNYGLNLAADIREDLADYFNNQVTYDRALDSILKSRQLRVIQNINFTRVFDDLERAMSRALNEFHRQKKYRLESNFMAAQEVQIKKIT